MIILGIDPGLATMGFGVVQRDERGVFTALDYGVVTTPKEENLPVRLAILERGVNAILDRYHPDEIAFEELFFTKNITTGIAVAQALLNSFVQNISTSTNAITKYTISDVDIFNMSPTK